MAFQVCDESLPRHLSAHLQRRRCGYVSIPPRGLPQLWVQQKDGVFSDGGGAEEHGAS